MLTNNKKGTSKIKVSAFCVYSIPKKAKFNMKSKNKTERGLI